MTDEDFLDGFALKFHGYVRVARAAWPHLKKSSGSIVNIIGAGGRTASADFTIGGSVNAALYNYTKALAQIGIRDGVRVNAINPGPVETDRLKGRINTVAREQGVDEDEARKRYLAELGLSRFAKPEEIGQLVCFLASPLAVNIHGALVDSEDRRRALRANPERAVWHAVRRALVSHLMIQPRPAAALAALPWVPHAAAALGLPPALIVERALAALAERGVVVDEGGTFATTLPHELT